MTEVSDENVYSRSSILQWVSDIFSEPYGNFSDVPAKFVAVLLYAIFNHSETDSPDHLTVSLHDIQFCDNPTPTTLFLNAKRVLSLVQTLSAAPYLSEGAAGGDTRTPTVGHMTPYAWLEGKSFVEELKMWRWIRAEAVRRGRGKAEVAGRVRAFLRGAAAAPAGREPEGKGEEKEKEKEKERERERGKGRERGEPPGGAEAEGKGEGSEASRKRLREEGEEKQQADSAPMGMHRADDGSVMSQRVQGLQESSLEDLSCSGSESAPHLLEVLKDVKNELRDKKALSAAGASAPSEAVSGEGKEGTTDGGRTSGHKYLACTSCPAIFSLAVKKNLEVIDKLEARRRMAIAACIKKDAKALLDVLSNF